MNLIKQNGKNYIESGVVMLSSKNIGQLQLILQLHNNKLSISHKDCISGISNEVWEGKHIYFTINEKIKEDDCFIDTDNIACQAKTPMLAKIANSKGCKKIISTTDESLKLPIPDSIAEYPMSYTPECFPKPPSDFIKLVMESYNDNNPIHKVLVEVEMIDYAVEDDSNSSFKYGLKLKENNIIIENKKETWDDIRGKYLETHHDFLDYDKWLEENYNIPTSKLKL